jgi:phosphoribosylformylglycinamidine synthase
VSGGEPIACTDCLNFGSPKDPEVYWQLGQAVKGMAEACRALKIPVISGNVSLYNESPQRAIDPTPIVGVAGLLEPVKGQLRTATQWFKRPGDRVYLAGESFDELGGSEYLAVLFKKKAGKPPRLDLKAEKALQGFAVAAIRAGLCDTAHDLSDGGLAVALAEMAVTGGRFGARPLGAEIALASRLRPEAALFGESQSRALFAVQPGQAKALESLARRHKVPLKALGAVKGDRLQVTLNSKPALDLGLEQLEKTWRTPLM